MEQDFFGRSCSKFPEAMEQLKSGSVFFSGRNAPTEIRVPF